MIIIAISTFRELIRQRIVHIGLLIAFFMFFLSEIVGSASMEQESRILFHFGFTAVQLSVVGISLFLGTFMIPREVERQTCLIVLARPITRTQFFLGKLLGLLSVNTTIIVLLTFLLWIMVPGGYPILGFFKVAFGIFLETLILLSLAFFGGLYLRPPAIGLFMTIGIFILGHWLEELVYFAVKSKQDLFITMANVIHAVIPHLYSMDWKSYYLLENNKVEASEVFWVGLHSAGWTILLLVFGIMSFRRKDLA